MAFDAFVSYSSKDKTAADAACVILESAGIRCWIAPRDIRAGREYGAAIIDAIDQSRVMVLIFSSNANESPQIHREIERAVSKGVLIVPVRIEEVTPTKSMEYFLGSIHWLDALSPPLENHLHRLAETVNAILQADAAARGGSVDNTTQKTSPARAADEAERTNLRGNAPNAQATTDNSILKTSHRPNWLLSALAGGFCVALLLGGVWFYQNRMSAPGSSSFRPIAQQGVTLDVNALVGRWVWWTNPTREKHKWSGDIIVVMTEQDRRNGGFSGWLNGDPITGQFGDSRPTWTRDLKEGPDRNGVKMQTWTVDRIELKDKKFIMTGTWRGAFEYNRESTDELDFVAVQQ